MAGGVLLLGFMTFFLDIRLIIPIHGVVQMVSNSSRCWYLRDHVKWDFFWPYILGAPFGFVIAYFVLENLSQKHWLYLLLTGLIFWGLFKPKKLPQIKLVGYQWSLLGILSGLQSALIGATGPLLAIFYLRDDLSKEQIVATKAMQQFITHLFKIPLFFTLNFDYAEYGLLITCMSAAAIAGSAIGVKILKRVNEKAFKLIFKSLLFFAALRMFFKFYEGQFAG